MKHHNDILVSTVIPSHNKHHFLKEALFSALNQTHENQEIIIINDYPTIEAREEIDALKALDKRILVFHNPTNIGIASSRNKAIALSKGQYIAMLDHDDIWVDPEKLSEQTTTLLSKDQLGVVGTWYRDIDKDGNILRNVARPTSDSDIRNTVNHMMPGLHSTLVFKKNVLEKVGGFTPKVSMTDDYDMVFKILKVAQMQNLPIYSTHYRYHNNTSAKPSNIRTMGIDSFLVLLQHGNAFPGFAKAVTIRLLLTIPYMYIRPYLSDELAGFAKSLRYKLFSPKLSQSYNHIDSQGGA